MSASPPKEGDARRLPLERIYTEVRQAIRETDAISFKLLGLVPLVSGTALVALILHEKGPPAGVVTLLALFAAAVTLGLFRWELRNIQTCSRLMRCADAIERIELREGNARGAYRPLPNPPQWIGKAEAEKLIYTTTLVAWIVLPLALGALPQLTEGARLFYVVSAGVLLLGAGLSCFARARIPAVEE
jgi:hypothetical protein